MVTHWFCVQGSEFCYSWDTCTVQVKSSKRFSVGRNSFSIEVDFAHEYVVMMRHMLSSAFKENLRNRPYRLGKQSIPIKLTFLMFSLMYKVICHSPGASLFDRRWFINQHLPEVCQKSGIPSISSSSQSSLDDHKTGKKRIFF